MLHFLAQTMVLVAALPHAKAWRRWVARKRLWQVGGCLAAFLSAGILFGLSERSSLLEQLTNYPNPFDSRQEPTTIAYKLTENVSVRVRIYDLFGMRVREFYFMPGEMGARAGLNTIQWDGRDGSGSSVSKGGYICQVIVEGDQSMRATRKIGVIH